MLQRPGELWFLYFIFIMLALLTYMHMINEQLMEFMNPYEPSNQQETINDQCESKTTSILVSYFRLSLLYEFIIPNVWSCSPPRYHIYLIQSVVLVKVKGINCWATQNYHFTTRDYVKVWGTMWSQISMGKRHNFFYVEGTNWAIQK